MFWESFNVDPLNEYLQGRARELPEDCFTVDPDLLSHQALNVEQIAFDLSDGSEQTFLVFLRLARIDPPDGCAPGHDGKVDGCEIVAYLCDERGAVHDWERRYEANALAARPALNKLKFQLVNGLAVLCNYEGALEGLEL